MIAAAAKFVGDRAAGYLRSHAQLFRQAETRLTALAQRITQLAQHGATVKPQAAQLAALWRRYSVMRGQLAQYRSVLGLAGYCELHDVDVGVPPVAVGAGLLTLLALAMGAWLSELDQLDQVVTGIERARRAA